MRVRGWVTFRSDLAQIPGFHGYRLRLQLIRPAPVGAWYIIPRLPTCDHAPDAQGPYPASRRRPHVRLHVRPSPARLPGQFAGQGQRRAVEARHDPGTGDRTARERRRWPTPSTPRAGTTWPPSAAGTVTPRSRTSPCSSRATRWPRWKAAISPSRMQLCSWNCANSGSTTRPGTRRRAAATKSLAGASSVPGCRLTVFSARIRKPGRDDPASGRPARDAGLPAGRRRAARLMAAPDG